jgi:CPA1 family monovalent cation:H+ antiporter
MEVFEVVIALLVGGAALAAIARRIGAPYPALVALAGAALALVPGVPTLVLDPELALALFVAPVLVDAAFDASPRDLRANWRAIASLALGAVALTIAVVAVVARLLVPDMPWAAAIALGAIVAPPDAAAATTVLKQLRPPNRLLVILEGESLFNDASALLVYRLAVGATVAAFSGWSVLPTLLVVTVGSVVLALVLSRLTLLVSARIRDVATAVVFQFCGTFLVWILAEQLHLSGIITTVVYAMAASRRAAEIVPARIRIPAWAVWEVAVFVLNVLAFILVGFQLKSIAARATGATGARYAVVAVAVTVAVIVARIAWVTATAAFSRWRCRPRADGTPGPRDAVALTGRAAAVVGWCGMRGTVTLAAALALPTDFPFRDLILATAFGVTLGTLVVQGLTLRPLLLRLRLEDDGSVGREVRLARVESLRAALAAAASCPGAETASLVRHRYELQLRRADRELAGDGVGANGAAPEGAAAARAPDADGRDADAAVVRAATDAQRRRLVALRADGTIGDAAFQRVEEELDWAELDWAQLLRTGERTDGEA